MKKKNVLFLVDKSGFGGVQTIANNLINSKINGVNMYYFFLRDIDYKFGTKKIKKSNVFYSKSKYRYNINSFFELKKLITEKEIDILHMNGNKSIIFGVLIKKLFFPKMKIIAHEHGGVFDNTSWYFKFIRWNNHQIDLFVCLSITRKKKIITYSSINYQKIEVLYNFVDINKFNRKKVNVNIKEKKENLKIGKKDFVIGYVGGLSYLKGVDILVKAFKKFRTDCIGKLIIVGDGPDKKYLEDLVYELEIKNDVIFTGYIDHPMHIYPIFDVLVMPSRSEAFGIVAIEASSLGIPTILSDIEELIEVSAKRKNNLFFKSQDPEDLCRKIQKMRLNHPKRSKDNVEDFSLDNYLSKIRDLYQRC